MGADEERIDAQGGDTVTSTETPVLAIESNGSYIPLPDPKYKEYSCVWEELTKADRNTTGFLIKQRIATKFTIEVSWVGLTSEEKNSVIELTNPNSFGVRFFDCMTDTFKYVSASEGGFYRGSGYTIDGWGRFDGTHFEYYDVTMSLIQR